MTENHTDDIFALCSRFDLDLDSYKVFSDRTQGSVDESQPEAVPAEPVAALPEPPVQSRRSEWPQHSVDAGDSSLNAESRIARADLRNLLRSLGVHRQEETGSQFDQLLSHGIYVYGAAGGTGASTVVATLGAMLAREGKACVVADARRGSLLPFLLAGTRVNGDTSWRAAAPAIRVVRWPHSAGPDANTNSPEHPWYRTSVSQLPGALDQLLVDVLPEFSRFNEPPVNGGVSLIVAVPDANSIAGAVAIKQRLAEEAPLSRVICVLNKFDQSVPLHADLAHWFEETFRTVRIRRTEVINKALTEGLTVADLAPGDSVIEDFAGLLNTVQQCLGTVQPETVDQDSLQGVQTCQK